MKLSKYDIYLTKRKNVENILCLVYQINGIKRVFTAYYSGNHKLIGVDEVHEERLIEYEGVEKILQENKHFCNLDNYPTSISKEDFIFKSIQVPYFSDFMRSETIARCPDYYSIFEERAAMLDNTLKVHILNRNRSPMITCVFNNTLENIEYDPGLTFKLVDNNDIHDFVGKKNKAVRITMTGAYSQSSLLDIACRMNMAIKTILAEVSPDDAEIEKLNLDDYYWEFIKYGDDLNHVLSNESSLEEITYKNGYELIYFPMKKKVEIERDPKPKISYFNTRYDCFCMLEEIDQTKQWVPCNIIGRKGSDFVVELRNYEGFQIIKKREYLLLSKEEMHKYEPDRF